MQDDAVVDEILRSRGRRGGDIMARIVLPITRIDLPITRIVLLIIGGRTIATRGTVFTAIRPLSVDVPPTTIARHRCAHAIRIAYGACAVVHHNVAALPTRLGVVGFGAGARRAVFIFSVPQATVVIIFSVHPAFFSVPTCRAHLAIPVFPGRTSRRHILLAGLGVLEGSA